MAEPDIPNPKVAVRQALNELSIGGSQGMVKCNCNCQCMTNRCGYKKSQLLHNSRCHGVTVKGILRIKSNQSTFVIKILSIKQLFNQFEIVYIFKSDSYLSEDTFTLAPQLIYVKIFSTYDSRIY
ncbi:hypothetical protein BpHYR1_030281 [Brachionus plicatilis]|uniref:Uncharacterized protein n=1 Tax=Brachionus plicatilis TaxID=10195 RepID=A0A3M7SPW5_BRAPC|nr:hypothetical protein BpHYR1_030281 [Brachionus plicatilis]